jgi:hypothetical protein
VQSYGVDAFSLTVPVFCFVKQKNQTVSRPPRNPRWR